MDFRVPELGEGVYEAELVAWLVKPGDAVKRGQNLMEVMTDKATMEVPSPFVGTVTGLNAEPGQQIKVGQAVLTYEPAEKPVEAPAVTAKASAPAKKTRAAARATAGNGSAADGRSAVPVQAAPSVRLMARKMGLDLAEVRGTGPGGRILIEDLASFSGPPPGGAPSPPAEPRPDYGTPGTRIKLIGLRRKIAEHMVLSKKTIPHYGYVDECDVTELVRLRQALKEPYARLGVRLTYLPFLVKAVVAALKEVPLVNATLDEQAGEIVLHDHYHIGIAVAAPQGLIVPVVHDADRKDLGQLARDIERLSADARSGKARLEDLKGGTFTITSIGSIGGLFSTPVIHYPEVGILGVGKIVKRPVFDAAGNVKAAEMVYLSFSFDHRVVDGAVGAAFGNAIIKQLQNPAAMLLPERM
jgi:2-oxoisovalerate dehydrogenase E2 component (dihydrolipoyl transacylase)